MRSRDPRRETTILAVLSLDILAQILVHLAGEDDCKSCRLVSRDFFRADCLQRSRLRVLRLDSLPALLSRYESVERLDLSACAGLTDRSISAALGGGSAAGVRALCLRRAAAGVSWRGIEAAAAGCPRLESLDLSHCLGVGDREVSAAASAAPGLRELSLEKCIGVTDLGLAKVAVGCPGLERLVIKWCLEITDVGVELLSKKCPGLKALDVSYLKVTNKSLLSIASLEKLEVLSMIGCDYIDDEGLGYLNNGNNSLQSVNVSRCYNVSFSGLATLLEGHKTLQNLDAGDCFLELSSLFLIKLSLVTTTLCRLKLHGCQASATSLQTIGGNCRNLIEIGLSKCKGVTDEGIAELVSGCSLLRSLDLTCCRELGDNALDAIASSCENLICLLLESCTLVTDKGIKSIATCCSNLQEIDLTDCSVNDTALKHLSKCSELRVLKLGLCPNISDKGIAHLGANCRELQELDLYRCVAVSDDGLAVLGGCCKKLKKLNLCYCAQITDNGLNHLSSLGALTDLELRGLVRVTCQGIASIAFGCRSLSELDLKQCYSVADAGFSAIARCIENLRQINISYCQISDAGLVRLLCSLKCLQDVKMVHLAHISKQGFELALSASCSRLKKLKLLTGLQKIISPVLIEVLEARGCRIRWLDKPMKLR